MKRFVCRDCLKLDARRSLGSSLSRAREYLRRTVLVAVWGLLWFSGAATSFGQNIITLDNGNSVVTLNPSGTRGVTSWTVDNTNQLYSQWFWYRIGSGTADQQNSLDTLGPSTITQSSSAEATISYAGSNGLTIAVTYLLTGGAPGSGASDLGESINITNGGSSPLDFHFFQYSNFTLNGGTSGGGGAGDSVQFQNSNAVSQWNGPLTNPPPDVETIAEAVITPKPNYREDGFVPNLLNEIANTPDYTLAQVNNNVPDPGVGQGDVSWSYEWDRTLNPGSSLLISKDKELSGVIPTGTPEPSTLALAAAAAGLVTLFGFPLRRRRMR